MKVPPLGIAEVFLGGHSSSPFLHYSHSVISAHSGQEFNDPAAFLDIFLLSFADGLWVMLKDRGEAEWGSEIALVLLIGGEFQFLLFLMPSS